MSRDRLHQLAGNQRDYYAKAFDYQHRHSPSLAELNYYALAGDYILSLRWGSGRIYQPVLDAMPDHAEKYEKLPIPLNTAAFNLTEYFGQGSTIDSLKKEDRVHDLLKGFRSITGHSLAIGNIIDNKETEDYLLLCYPGKILKSRFEIRPNKDAGRIKSIFFAFLWHKDFLTEQQLVDHSLLQGRHSYEIPEEKARLEKLGLSGRPNRKKAISEILAV